jgi:copper(I)-binding protein
MRVKNLFLLVLLGILLSACGDGELQISDAWARPGLASNNSAIFFTIENPSKDSKRLLGVRCNAAGSAEVHRSFMEDEVMKMELQEYVGIPPKSQLSFEPGGYHVMLIDLKSDLNEGDLVNLVLEFENTGDVQLQVEVQER